MNDQIPDQPKSAESTQTDTSAQASQNPEVAASATSSETTPVKPEIDVPEKRNTNAIQEYPHAQPYEKAEDFDPRKTETVFIASMDGEKATKALEGNIEAEKEDTPHARRWKAVTETGFMALATGMQYKFTLARQDSEFYQYLGTERGKIGFSSPRFAEEGVNKVSGEKAQLRVRALLGLGGILTIPLWHSGFHITIKTPSESAMLELRRRIIEQKVALGRATHGLVFSNTSSYISDLLLSFVIDHVYDSTLKNATNLRAKILTPDLPILFWGLACSIFPKGFQYARSLMDREAVSEKKIISGIINVAKLMWVDNTSFTKYQKAHMSNRQSSVMTDEMLERYQQDFPLYKGRTFDIKDNLKVTLTVPTAEEYIRSGQIWVSALSSLVEQAFTGEDQDTDARNSAIAEHANATIMRQYGHWVKSVEVDGSEQTDRETIDSILETMSEDSDVRAKFHENVGKYIDDVTTAVIAIPEVTSKDNGLEKFPNLIPLDVVSVFFTLLMRRTEKILER